MSIHPAIIDWRKIEDQKPPEGVKLMICGPSSWIGFNHYLLIAYYDEEYRPSRDGAIRWLTLGNDAVTDEYMPPTHWAYPPKFPEP